MGRGRSFQREGAAAEKAPVTPGPALSPDGFVFAPANLRQRVGAWRSERQGGVIQGFEGGEQYFEVNPVFDRKPVEVSEDRGDVFIAAGGGEQTSGRVLNILEFIEDNVWRSIQDAVAVVQSGGYEGMNQSLGGGKGQRGPEACNVLEVEEGDIQCTIYNSKRILRSLQEALCHLSLKDMLFSIMGHLHFRVHSLAYNTSHEEPFLLFAQIRPWTMILGTVRILL